LAKPKTQAAFLLLKITIEADKVNSKFEIIRFGMPDFDNCLNAFISLSKTSPVYSSAFSDFYQEVQNKAEQNMSILINLSGTTVLGLLFSSPNQVKDDNFVLTYFGLPANLLVSEAASAEILNEATKVLLQNLNDSGIPVANGRIAIPHTLQINPSSLKSNKIERVFFSNKNVVSRFDRVIDITRNKELIRSEYSKSVRMALKGEPLGINITSCRDSLDSIRYELNALKKLHFLSAGRLTRSEKSWELQFDMIKKGSGLIVSGMYNKEIVTSALFMLNASTAFYGVSASDYSENRAAPASHHLLDYAITGFKNLGIHEIWLGSQHTSSISEVSIKEKQIEEFKSYFGGAIYTSLISKAGSSHEQ
jgi:hypothetical protein